VPWPREGVIASLRRGRRLLIPHGDTRLQAGDVLAVVAEGAARNEILALTQKLADAA
jgi:CIC family chloride channel protein